MANTIELIRLDPVTSSNLAALGYDALRQRAGVQFKNGKIIYYAGVPANVMHKWLTSASLGQYYAAEIRGKYQGELMTGECPDCGNGPGFVGQKCDSCGCAEYVVPKRGVANE